MDPERIRVWSIERATEQVIAILKGQKTGMKTTDLCRNVSEYGISEGAIAY
jgi:hypothetical protein